MFLLLFFQFFDDFADVLGAIARTNQQGVGRLHDDEIVNADGGDEFARAPEEISRGVERQAWTGENILAWLFGEKFVDRGPGADVAPADFGGNDEDARLALLASGGFEDGVVDGNIFELRIDGAEVASRSCVCRCWRPAFRGRRAFSADGCADCRGMWRRARKTFRRSSGSGRSRRTLSPVRARVFR